LTSPTELNQLHLAIDRFVHLMRERFESNVFTTEDSVRYTFFAALLNSGINPKKTVLEFKTEELPGREIDTAILGEDESPHTLIEFKYHRASPGTHSSPRTQKAGDLLGDMIRLNTVPGPLQRIVVYVTDQEMAGHFRSSRNGLEPIFNLAKDHSLELTEDWFAKAAHTLRNRLPSWSGPFHVTLRAVSRD